MSWLGWWRRRPPRFQNPSELWEYSMDVVSRLRAAGLNDAADTLETGVRHVTSSGWEWLGELGLAAGRVSKGYRTPPELRQALETIIRTARSRRPYG
jgi:hypothetical protein